MTSKELAGALQRQLNPRRARWQKPAAVVRALGLRRGQVIAEIGAGPGYFTPRLARAVNVDWNDESEFGPPPKRRVPRARFLRDARRAGLRLIAESALLSHQYFLVLRRAR